MPISKYFVIFILSFAVAGSAYSEPEILKYRGTPYVSGGVTEKERKRMDRIAGRFPMHIVLISDQSEQPISGAKVTVKDISGNVLVEAVSEGPLFFVDVIGGRYTVEAEYNGELLTETKDLTGRRHLRLRFRFGASD